MISLRILRRSLRIYGEDVKKCIKLMVCNLNLEI